MSKGAIAVFALHQVQLGSSDYIPFADQTCLQLGLKAVAKHA